MSDAHSSGVLLPCPFCGGNNITGPDHDDEWGMWTITCSDCMGGIWADNDGKTVRAWNTRATPAPSDQAGWQDIATAPRDGTQILIEVRAGYYAVVSYWGAAWREGANGLQLRDPPLAWMAITTPTLTAGEGDGDE